ncbi:angiogenic factor with G patch and FHA domains 1 isoform X1 [Nilaparvata lugens]|uniref:angiogenic factor with G patch and FHA domains 1 isoform X1 n=1 Tax=Nilaparvata lugens TaxID=108931 RepID=UPI00193E03A7|nr:angiogenic factor with G patch and FHA domains 1 isoform X1 [Nilaparvata lugens]XP_039277792.1 angiogenic factor with G patch and FHA domains 1 isoform X1 [Nilaparvata lugens]
MCDTENEIILEDEEDNNLFQDISQSFESSLTDLPEVVLYIKRLQDCVIRQRRIIITLHEKVKQGRPVADASTQTDWEDALPVPVPWQQSSSNGGGRESSSSSIVDQVKEAAESAVRQSGFVYEATSGMYYDYNTGYYYNAELGLYYDGNSGTYYSYNEEEKEFRYHSSVGVTQHSNDTCSSKHQQSSPDQSKQSDSDSKVTLVDSPKAAIDKDTARHTLEEMEEGECSRDSSIADCSSLSRKVVDDHLSKKQDIICDSSPIEPMQTDSACTKNTFEEIANSWPPCMRVIVQETDLDKLNVGSLFIVTCIGGTLGREGDHSIIVPDLKISKHHAKISFCEETGKYEIVDFGSRNGTYLNGARLSVALQESDPKPLSHGDILRVGMTHLLCHIHQGQETCEQCEPGCCIRPPKDKVEQIDTTEYSKDKHRTELRRLRKKFGLENAGATAVVPKSSSYVDRAEARRKTVGSTDESFKTEAASVHETIKSDNKGFKMLSKMGWSEGQALGKDTGDPSSITQPILVEQRRSKVGLGCEETEPVTTDNKEVKKALIWKKARKRYNKLS